MSRDRCPSRIAHESGVVLRCQDVPGHEGNHVTVREQWGDDDDRVLLHLSDGGGYASGGIITTREPSDDRIPAFLSNGCAFFPGVDGDLVELGDVDAQGRPSPAEAHFGADVLRRMNGGGS